MPVVVIVVICVASYATAVVIVRRGVAPHSGGVGPIELVSIGAALILSTARRHPYSIAYALTCASATAVLGGALTALTRTRNEIGRGGTREFEEAQATHGPESPWRKWLRFSRSVVDYEIRIVLAACYFVVIAPMAIVFRTLRADRAEHGASNWIPRPEQAPVNHLRRPF